MFALWADVRSDASFVSPAHRARSQGWSRRGVRRRREDLRRDRRQLHQVQCASGHIRERRSQTHSRTSKDVSDAPSLCSSPSEIPTLVASAPGWTPSESEDTCMLCGQNMSWRWTRSDGMYIHLKIFWDHTTYWTVVGKDGSREMSDVMGTAREVMKLVDERYPW